MSVKKIAKVIVDVPLMQTDKPFSYLVPEEFQEILKIGMRVHVPFGRSNRLLQGIVIGFSDVSEESTQLKEIVECLDFQPVLTKEQLSLADQMRHRVFSYKITCLKAMLPNLLNSNYDKILTDKEGSEQLWSQLSENEKKSALKSIQSGDLKVDYLA
ncbi:MAG: primosomal protein N', partial [Streptococcaceae bacterium]|nr:primosomal protein N' [Streptococcaceae bacterium]